MTMMFLLVILGATDKRAPAGFAPLAIGLCLTLIHLISIPVTNTSVNPARSTGVARVRRRLGDRAAVGILGRPDRRRRAGCAGLPGHRRRRLTGVGPATARRWGHSGSAVVFFTRSSTKLVLQSSTLGWRSSVSITKRE